VFKHSQSVGSDWSIGSPATVWGSIGWQDPGEGGIHVCIIGDVRGALREDAVKGLVVVYHGLCVLNSLLRSFLSCRRQWATRAERHVAPL
jgi:hypothetical protein